MGTLSKRTWGELLFGGIVALLFGIIASVWPGRTLMTIMVFFGVFILIEGIITVVISIMRRSTYKRWWLPLIGGAVGILIGVLTIAHPFGTTLFLLYMVAIWALITGIISIITAIRLRREISREWYLILSGIVAIIFSIFIFARPAAAAVTIMWIISAFAILFGILLIVLAIRIRNAAKQQSV
jgi:uncharacterized membrane protein HdeD (DUF308 family)